MGPCTRMHSWCGVSVCHVVQEDMHWRGRGDRMEAAGGDVAVSFLSPMGQVIGSGSPKPMRKVLILSRPVGVLFRPLSRKGLSRYAGLRRKPCPKTKRNGSQESIGQGTLWSVVAKRKSKENG
jgi:hypothetical protein